MTDESINIANNAAATLARDMAKAEDEMFFVGIKKMPAWANQGTQKISWKLLKFKIYSLFMDKTKSMRWKIAYWFAPDIHDDCDW